MDRLKLLWTHPAVQWNGRGISEAWAEEMQQHGFEPVEDPAQADMAFFISDSQLNPTVIGKMPTVAYFWGWAPWRAFEPDFQEWATKQVTLLDQCTRVLAPGLTTWYQLCDFGVKSQLCLPGVDYRTLDQHSRVERSVQAVKRGIVKVQVAFLSRLVPYKGLEFLINALSYLYPRIPLLVMGSGGDKTPYEKLAEALHVPITFVEPTDEEKVKHLQESLLLVHPSEYEGFGLAPLEALYLGVPVVVRDIPQMRWLLREDAYYFSSPEALAKIIAELLGEYPKTIERVQSGMDRVRETLTLAQAAQRLWAHLHQAHKEFWGKLVRDNPHDKDLVKRAYEAEHCRNWAYGMSNADVNAPLRFDPEWARHWRAQHFIKELGEAQAQKVLDVGCGAVYPTILARAGFQVTGLDVSREALDQAATLAEKWGMKDKVEFVQDYAQALPFPDNAFDAVVLGEILEHIPDPDKVLAEAMRVVRPGGRVIASTPIGHEHFDWYHIASEDGGWNDQLIENLLRPWGNQVVKVEKIAEDGVNPSCFLLVLEKEVEHLVGAE